MPEKPTGITVIKWEKITENDEEKELPQREILVQIDAKKCAAYAAFNAIEAWTKRNKPDLIVISDPEGLFDRAVSHNDDYLDKGTGMANNNGVARMMAQLNERFNPSGIFINVESTGSNLLDALKKGDTIVFHNGVNHEIALIGYRDGMIEKADSLSSNGKSQWVNEKDLIITMGNSYNMTYIVTTEKPTRTSLKPGDRADLQSGKKIEILGVNDVK